ncbi:uncharacterized [Tachysurus ichikawai]
MSSGILKHEVDIKLQDIYSYVPKLRVDIYIMHRVVCMLYAWWTRKYQWILNISQLEERKFAGVLLLEPVIVASLMTSRSFLPT